MLTSSGPYNDGPPMYRDGRTPLPQDPISRLIYDEPKVVRLVELSVGLDFVPTEFQQTRSRIGNSYHVVTFQIEVTYFITFVRCELIHDNINYGALSTEYMWCEEYLQE